MRVFNWIGLGLTTKALAYEPFEHRLTRSRARSRHQSGHRRSDRYQKYVPARVSDIQNEEADEEEYVWSKERFNLDEFWYIYDLG